ncbi:uncharacterized protein CYBJADRAFT_75055 [Cyberlindnera jadinii NRRL Y-1542]|uniref:Uncharacterized protein n=1 Tax=Cyberlindnera jadinii (strain ATCC 18201 / CBS 1600 / BCRC 20928 / JCM 3617 / NBRC 0987 / NRRL Y-1542) TaxID=983966 RepID=A0A1E4S4Y1_CYBJN|nr:hypothetical protein CYBJADRAFT_75055 [Cyberlindnera jadinii NRRL Y-1542]ODV74503.1 hypothetical protein CYBJADRAFT_75055 [Cyberlindnera jadinii NRRL Y-1542]
MLSNWTNSYPTVQNVGTIKVQPPNPASASSIRPIRSLSLAFGQRGARSATLLITPSGLNSALKDTQREPTLSMCTSLLLTEISRSLHRKA